MGNLVWLLALIFPILFIVAFWKIFIKAGRPGWYSLIPLLNTYQMIKIARQPGWMFFLLFIPLINIILAIVLSLELAKAFGRSGAFGIFLLLLTPFGYLILGFGKSIYVYGNSAPAASPAPAAVPAQPAAPAAAPAQTPPAEAPKQ